MFWRPCKLDQVCTREIRLFFLSRNNRANPSRLCLNKFISCHDSESEISWSIGKTAQTPLSSLAPSLFVLSWFTNFYFPGPNSLTNASVIVPRPNFTASISTSVLQLSVWPTVLVKPFQECWLNFRGNTGAFDLGEMGSVLQYFMSLTSSTSIKATS